MVPCRGRPSRRRWPRRGSSGNAWRLMPADRTSDPRAHRATGRGRRHLPWGARHSGLPDDQRTVGRALTARDPCPHRQLHSHPGRQPVQGAAGSAAWRRYSRPPFARRRAHRDPGRCAPTPAAWPHAHGGSRTWPLQARRGGLGLQAMGWLRVQTPGRASRDLRGPPGRDRARQCRTR
jgi:hypothetical protein